MEGTGGAGRWAWHPGVVGHRGSVLGWAVAGDRVEDDEKAGFGLDPIAGWIFRADGAC